MPYSLATANDYLQEDATAKSQGALASTTVPDRSDSPPAQTHSNCFRNAIHADAVACSFSQEKGVSQPEISADIFDFFFFYFPFPSSPDLPNGERFRLNLRCTGVAGSTHPTHRATEQRQQPQ